MEEQVYMVEFVVPFLDQEMMDLIPRQRMIINDYMLEKKISTYSLSEDRGRLWAVFTVRSEDELLELIEALPMTAYMSYDYTQLMFHNMLQIVPSHSLN